MLRLQSIQILTTQTLRQGFFLREPDKWRSSADDLGTDTSGDADEREGSSRSNLQAKLESEFNAITLSRKKPLLRPLMVQSLLKVSGNDAA